MKRSFTLLMSIICFCCFLASANEANDSNRPLITNVDKTEVTVWHVGPTRTYKKPSEISALVQDGDIIEIDAADYVGDVMRWTKNNLTIRGVGGTPNPDAN